MATDKYGTWSDGESILWYSPNTTLDTTWSDGESYLIDEYIEDGANLSVIYTDDRQIFEIDGHIYYIEAS